MPAEAFLYVGRDEGNAAYQRNFQYSKSFGIRTKEEVAQEQFETMMSQPYTIPEAAEAAAQDATHGKRRQYDIERQDTQVAPGEPAPAVILSDSHLYWTHTIQAQERLEAYKHFKQVRAQEKEKQEQQRKALGVKREQFYSVPSTGRAYDPLFRLPFHY